MLMAVEYKAIERHNPRDKTDTKFYAVSKSSGVAEFRTLCEEIEGSSSLSGADVQGVVYALADALCRHLADGKTVRLGDLGHFRMGLRSKGEMKEDDVDVHSIEGARIIYTPSRKLSGFTKSLQYKKM